MNWKRFLFSLFFISILILLSFLIFGQWSLKRSGPDYAGELTFSSLYEGARITRDQYGVPFIRTNTPYDLFFAWGFVNAQDRIWQMEYFRRLANGQLSQILGPTKLKSDRLARTIGFSRLAARTFQECNKETQLALQAFVQGINAYLERSRKSLPPEFSITSFSPEPWTPLDPLAIWHFFSFNMAGVWNFDLFATSLVNKNSPAAAKQLYSQFDRFSGFSIPLQNIHSPWQEYSLSGLARIKHSDPGTLEYHLFSLPHLPNTFYWVHLKSDSIDTYVSHVPGVPFPWSGTEDGFAWSMIPAWSDRVDFYAITIDPNDTTRYIIDGQSHELEYQEEIIPVRGRTAQHLLVRKTHHGPLVDRTGVYTSDDKRPLSLAWAGQLEGQEIDALYHLLTQKNQRKMSVFDSLTRLSAYLVYTDKNGNYGYHLAAGFPRRRSQTGLFVMDGSDSRNDWKAETDKIGQTISDIKETMVLLTSVNNQVNEYPFQVIRQDMALEHVKENPVLSFREFEPVAFQIKQALPHLLPPLQESIDDSASIYAVVNLLKQLDYQSRDPKIAVTFFKLYYDLFYASLFKDQMDGLYPLFKSWPVCDCTWLSKAFSNQLNYWIDDINTIEKESVDELVVRAFYQTLDSIRVMGPDMGAWLEDHNISMQPLLSLQPAVAIIYGLGGSEYRPARVPIQSIKASVDSRQSLVVQCIGGQSGHPDSEFYHVECKTLSLPGSVTNHTLLFHAK